MILIATPHICSGFRAAVFKHGRHYYQVWDGNYVAAQGAPFSLGRSTRTLRVTCGACLRHSVPLTCIDCDSDGYVDLGDVDGPWEALLADPLERIMEALL